MAEEGALPNTARAERPARRRTRRRSIFRRVFQVLAIIVLLPFVLLPLYAVVNPPVTTVMVLKLFGGAPIHKTWSPLDDISPDLIRAVLISEDARFCQHHGIDWVEVQNALDDEDGRLRGASTITMQTAKNLFLWTGRSWIRKALEVPIALYADLVLSKKRIMEIYLNSVEWGVGIYGAAAAAEHYFGTSPDKLSATQAARLAAILPAPTVRDAAEPGAGTRRIARRIAARAAQSGPYVACVIG
jgi:monofunctional biosynthetic peptidoglycan transglycosylase